MSASENITQAHRETIGASQSYKIMSFLQHDNLPKGAVSLVETMCRGSDEDLETVYELNTPAILWGREHEVEAVESIAVELGCSIEFSGAFQQRMHAGENYSNFISALPDAIGVFSDFSIVTIEVKCLDTHNHDYIIAAVGDSYEALKREDWAKYCQVHTQNICAEAYYGKPVSSIIVFYDPRSEFKKLHYVIVVDAGDPSTIDHEFRAKLKQRAMLARNLYDSIKAEPDRAPVIYDGVMPETKMVKSADFVLTPAILERGVEEIARTVAESIGVEIVDLVIENGKVMSYHLKGGEVFDCEVKEGRELSEKLEKRIKKVIPIVKKANAPLREKALAEHRKYAKTDRLIEALIMPIVNHVGAKRAEWDAEQKRIQDAALAEEAKKKRLAEEKAEQVRQAILAKIETFTVSPQDISSLELIAAKRLQVESVFIDVMFGEFEQQAHEAKETAIECLLHAEADLKQAIAEAEKQSRLDAFEVFKAKCDALKDPLHSVEYLESQRFKLFNTVPQSSVFGEYYADVLVLQSETMDALNDSLIPAAKQRAIDLAEKLKAEELEAQAKIAEQEKATELHLVEIPNATVNVIVRNAEIEPAPQHTQVDAEEILVDATADYTTVQQCERVINENIIAMYAALNPVLHAKVIEAAGKVLEYQASEQKASFLHNLFENTKQGKELKSVFIALVK